MLALSKGQVPLFCMCSSCWHRWHDPTLWGHP